MGIENTKGGKLLNHIYENYLIYLNGFNTLVFAIIGILFELNTVVTRYEINTKTIGWILFAFVIILTVIQIVQQIKETKSLEKIEREKTGEINSLKVEKGELDIKIQNLENQISKINNNSIEIVQIHLAYLFEKMKLENSERISLYKFIDDKFYVLGRFSSNPEFKKRGRSCYNKEGLIFKAWQLGYYFKNSGIVNPNMSSRTKFRKGYYKVVNEIAIIDEKTVWEMNMKSRSFYLKALKDSSNVENTSIIVIESINDKGFEEAFINSILNQDEEKKLVTFVEKIDWDFPNIHKANEKGF
jgi:hypothetical protein